MATPPVGPGALAWIERGLEILDGTGLRPDEQLDVLGLLSLYALIHDRSTHDEARARAERAAAGVESDFLALVRAVADPGRFPRLHAIAADAAGWDGTAVDPLDEFAAHVEVILDGVDAMIRAARRRRRGGAAAG